MAEASGAAGAGGASGVSLDSLAVPGVQALDGAQQAADAQHARHSSSTAYVARIRSRTEFTHLGTVRASQVAREAFPEVIDHPAGGSPALPAGQRIARYIAPNAAQLDLPGGKHGVMESMQPIAKEASTGHFTPIDLGITEAGGGYAPKAPNVGVQIPKHVAAGVQMPQTGVSLTPVDAQGEPLQGSEGSVNGSTVLYANTQTDTDTVVKPTTAGFEIDVLLRSAQSPGRLYFHVGMPSGARLVQQRSSGTALVVDGGQTVAVLSTPVAQDAAGTPVPLSTSISASTLILTVSSDTSEYQYPIEVDPTVTDTQVLAIHNGATYQSRWKVNTSNGKEGPFHFSESTSYGIRDHHGEGESPGYVSGEWGGFAYEAKGESTIYEVHVESSLSDEGHGFENQAQIRNKVHTGQNESPLEIRTNSYNEESWPGWKLCILPECAVPGEVTSEIAENNMSLIQVASQTGNYTMNSELHSAYVSIVQTKGSTVNFDTTDKEIAGSQNALYGAERWVTSAAAVAKGIAADPGIGVSEVTFSSPSESKWGVGESFLYPSSAACEGVICPREESRSVNLSGLPDGKDTVNFTGANATDTKEQAAKVSATVYVDSTAPHNITVSGLGSGNEIGEGTRNVKVEATDGSGSTPSSGVKSIAVAIDGHEIGKSAGSCSPGPCTAKGEWTINGGEYGAGEHKLKVTTTDNAGNVAKEERSLKEYRSTPVSLGPGSVAPQSGQFSLGATDVSIGAPGSSLTISQSYRSRYLTAGSEGPLGPQWSLSVGGQESITKLPNGNATLTATNGGQTTFTTNEKGGFAAPPGDINLALSEVKNEKGELTEYLLKNAAAATTTRFTSPSGPTASLWRPTKQEGPLASQTVRYFYQTVEGVTRPIEALAPVPLGLSCISQVEKKEPLEKGCRALTFRYAEKTSAGEQKSEWGEYKGRLLEVLLTAYNPSSKEMKPVAVAMYAYDSQGRMRAEWDPRISPALKTIYGYDSEGHVTALTSPGRESWAFTYGEIPGDASTGRLLKLTQAPGSAGLWNGESTKNTEAPKLSGSVVVGVTMGVSNGTWSNSPVAYSYQWEDCNAEGKECTPIVGAINANYKVAESDVGHTLVALVNATNGGGTSAAISAASSHVLKTYELTEYSLPKESYPIGIALGSDKNLWFTDFTSEKIANITTTGAIKEYSLPQGSNPRGITAGPDGNLWFTIGGMSRVSQITTSGSISNYSVPASSWPRGITAGADGNLWFTDYETSKIGKITTSGSITEYALSAGSHPEAITAGADGNLWFTDFGTSKIGKITTSGSITEYALPSGSQPQAITRGPDENLWYADGGTSKIGKITTSGLITEYSLPSGSSPAGIATGPDKNIWFTDYATSRVGRITTAGGITEYALPSGSFPWGITAGPDENLWFVEEASSSRIGKIKAASMAEGTHYAPGPGTTIEYGIPTSGPGLPTLTKGEVEKWGQTDDPTEGVAIFPPDEPMGWPASDYRRASFTYTDSKDKTVNTVAPSGGISTTEYNSNNDVVRTLSPDNRAAALKEGTKTAEVSKLLDTESTYNTTGSEPGTELLSTLGPQHTVKLVSGTQVQARAQTLYSYNEGAPSEGGPYHLVTKTTASALVAGKEEDPRTTKTSYSGQENLGWKLRKPTAVTTDPGGLNLVHTTVYDPLTGNVLESRSPAGSGSGSPTAPVYAFQFGSAGSGGGQFSEPEYDAVDSHSNVWVSDRHNMRIEEFSPSGTFMLAVGWGVKDGKAEAETCTSSCRAGISGSGSGQFEAALGIAVNQSSGNVYVADYASDRVQEFSSAGVFVAAFGSKGSGAGQFASPEGVSIDSGGNLWVSDTANNRIEELSSSGTFMLAVGWGVKDGKAEAETCTSSCRAGISGSGNGQLGDPTGSAFSGGKIYVMDFLNNRVEEFSSSGAYLSKFGSKGSGSGQFEGPYGIASDPTTGALYVADSSNNRVQKFTATGTFLSTFGSLGSGNGQLNLPVGVAVNSSGIVYVSDYRNSRIEEWEPIPSSPVYASQFGTAGSGNGQLKEPAELALDGKGHIWAADELNNRIEELGEKGEFVRAVGSEGTGNGQFKWPRGIAVGPGGNVWVADTANNRVQEFNEKGEYLKTVGSEGSGNGQFKYPRWVSFDSHGNLWVVDSNNNRVEELNEEGEYLKTVGSLGSGNGQLNSPRGVAVDAKGNIWVTDMENHRVEEFNEKGEYVKVFGSWGTGNGQFKQPKGIIIDANSNVWVTDTSNDVVQAFNQNGEYLTQFGSKGSGNGQFLEPWGIAIDAQANIWIADGNNNRIEKWTPAPRPGNEGAHDTKIAYYTAKAESPVAACQNHPEWVNLPCQTEPAAQTGVGGSPELPVSTTTYNIWDTPETVTEKFGSTTRTKTLTYDPAGRLKTGAVSSTVGTALPTVTNAYNTETGALEKQSTTAEGKTKTITSVYNTLGQLGSYTDADEITSTYEYDEDGRIHKTSDGKGTQTYTYDKTTGELTELVDSSHEGMKFTATYDVEGNMLTEGYPNGMTATYTYNQTGKPTALEYKKTTYCTEEEKEKCKWFKDTIVPSIHGQWLEQTSTFSHQAYTYDAAGRLTQAQNTPVGKGCTTRIYAYDEDTNRTSLTTREPGSEGKCATEGGTVEQHSYDAADRLIDAGTGYSTFGNIIALPAADAEGSELTSAYYVDNQLQSQTQNGQTIGYNLDPAGRTRETVATGKKVSDITSHYAGSGNSPAWTTNGTGETTRNIAGINGGLAAIQNNLEAPVLQLTNLHGDIIATAYLSETATALASSADTSEFGVPTTSLPPKYSWLGAMELPTELPSGVVAMGARSYVPQLGRFLQPDPIHGGSAGAYTYTFGDPINSADPSGEYTWGFSASLTASLNAVGQEIAAREAAREAAARAAAEAAARESAENAARAAGPQYEGGEEGGEEWEEYEEEEGGYEYASYHHGEKPGSEEGHIEDGVLYQPLQEEGGQVDGEAAEEGSHVVGIRYHDPFPANPRFHRPRSRPQRHQCVPNENGYSRPGPGSPNANGQQPSNFEKAWTNVFAAASEDYR